MQVRNLILTGGINHDFIDTAKALDEVLARFYSKLHFGVREKNHETN